MPPEDTDVARTEPVIETPPPLPPVREPFWGYMDVALVIGLLAFACVVIGGAVFIAAGFYPALRKDPTPLIVPTNLACYLALYLIFRVIFDNRYGMPVFASLGWRRTTHAAVLGSVIAAVPLAFLVNAFAYLLHTPKIKTPFEDIAKTPVMLALVGVMAVTAAPIFEELFFRGFLQPLFSRTFGIVAGVLLTAILFGGLHAAEYQFVWQYVAAVSLVGIALGVVRVVTNSIIPSTIMHGCYNASFVIALALTKHA